LRPNTEGNYGKGRKGKGMGFGKIAKAKLSSITLEYTGSNCVGFGCNTQPDGKTSVEGDPNGEHDVIEALVQCSFCVHLH
jgi:hypothetical protein